MAGSSPTQRTILKLMEAGAAIGTAVAPSGRSPPLGPMRLPVQTFWPTRPDATQPQRSPASHAPHPSHPSRPSHAPRGTLPPHTLMQPRCTRPPRSASFKLHTRTLIPLGLPHRACPDWSLAAIADQLGPDTSSKRHLRHGPNLLVLDHRR